MKKSIRKMLGALLLGSSLTLVSCVGTRETPLANPGILSQKTAARTTRAVPAFAAMTPGKASVGMIGAALMISSGNQIIRSNQVEDPADWISKELAVAIGIKERAIRVSPCISTSVIVESDRTNINPVLS